MSDIKAFKNQDYESLKSMHNESNLFEDPLFPADASSLYFSQSPPHGIKWMRPKEAKTNPKFFVNDLSHCDMDQGHLGNCWFIAACVSIAQNETIFNKVVPQNQSFEENYAGIFHFRFWLYGQWVDVVVDDRLPYWPDGRLLFCCNKDQPDEYWSPLLEKAYAKLYKTYENLDAGQTYDALVDMTGGIQEQFDLKEFRASGKSKLWKMMTSMFEKNSFMGCSIAADPRVREARMTNGLVRGHAYTITKLINLNGNNLIRVRNPWGNEIEWKGSWSDSSSEWNSISEDEKQAVGFVKDKDGEFWMEFSDFLNNFEGLQICHLTGESLSDELAQSDQDLDLVWKCKTYQSKWVVGDTAGGCGQHNQAKFWTNPQFLVTLTDVDKDDNENMATVIVALMQKDSRLKRNHSDSSTEEFIQFKLFKIKDGVDVDENKTTGLKLYASQLDRIGSSGSYINSREVTKRFRVEPGNYLILPSTYEEDKECEFMLRVFTEQPIEGDPLDQPKGDLDDNDTFFEIKDEDITFKNWMSILSPKVFKTVGKILRDPNAAANRARNVVDPNNDGRFDMNDLNYHLTHNQDQIISGFKSGFKFAQNHFFK